MQLKNDKVLALLGLATKSGNVVSGEFMVEKCVKAGKAYLVIVAGDASDNTKKSFTDMCDFYKVPILFYSDRDSLGKCIGKEFRVSVAVKNEGFADSILKKVEDSKQQTEVNK